VIRKLRADGDQLWMQGADGIQGRAEANDHLGSALAAGDFDGNGAEDLLAGASSRTTTRAPRSRSISPVPPHGDPTPPSISAFVSGPQGRNGWCTGDVTVRLEITTRSRPSALPVRIAGSR
jgi:hypothetical protein